jgi:alpha-galactosidase
MRRAKIVVIGAGSASFGLTNLGAILRTPELRGSELCLVDLNGDGLRSVSVLAQKMNDAWGAGFAIRSGVERRSLLPGADFVVLSVAVDREKCWELDFRIAQKHGIMHYAENGGPGGLMHGSRNIALIMPILRDIEELCPQALVLNFTNPVPRICAAAARHTGVRMIGICHQIEFGYTIVAKVLAKETGIDVPDDYLFRWDERTEKQFRAIVEAAEKRIDIQAAGINHFTWMLSIRERATGKDLYPLFRERYLGGFRDFEPLTRRIFDLLGVCPVPGDCHMVEYLPFTHNMAKGLWGRYDIQMYPLKEAAEDRDLMWTQIEEMAKGTRSFEHLRSVHTERAELIMAAVVGNRHAFEPAINLPNRGYIENLPAGSIVEVPAEVNAGGLRGIGVGSLPVEIAELCRRQIAVAELAVDAAVLGDRDLAVRALLLDQMVDDPEVAPALLDDYLQAERRYLPQFFGKPPWL